MDKLSKVLLLHFILMTVRFIHKFTGYIMMGASKDAQFVSLSAMEEAWFELRAFSVHILYLHYCANLRADSRRNRLLELPDPIENLLQAYDFIRLSATMCVSVVARWLDSLGIAHIRSHTIIYAYKRLLGIF